MTRRRPTIADMRAMKGKRQLTMLRVLTLEELEAAERADVDIVSVPPDLMLDPRFRDAAPGIFAMPGDNFYEIGGAEDFVRWAFRLYKATADAVYCSAGFNTVRRLAEDAIPVIGHVGLIPSRATWTGGFRAVGKTADSAMEVFDAVKKYEAAGAFGAEIEVVPVEVAQAICERTSLFMISMGSGSGCDAQYLFADDVLGQIEDTCRDTRRSTATLQGSMTGCNESGLRPFQSSSPTSMTGRFRKGNTSFKWTRPSWSDFSGTSRLADINSLELLCD